VLVVKDPRSNQVWWVLTTLKPIDRKKMMDGMAIDPAELKHQNKVYYVSKDKSGSLHFVSDKMVLFAANEGAMNSALNQVESPSKSTRLNNSLKLVDGRNQLVVGFIPPAEAVAQGKQGLQGNPMTASFVPLLELQGGSVVVNLAGKTLQLEVNINYPGDPQAKAAKTSLDNLKTQAKGFLLFVQDAAQRADAQKALDSLAIDQKGPDVQVKMSGDINVKDIVKAAGGAMQGPMGGPVGRAAGNVASQNNLKQIGLAFHLYADTHTGQFPAAVISKGNEPLYSWRVELLPHLEQRNLHNTFRGLTWDDPRRKKLAEQMMPKVFQIPGRPAPPGMTYYKLFTGPKALFDGSKQPRLPGDFKKGTSNTILVVEAATPVFWTQPEDIKFDPNRNPLDDLGWDASGSCNVLMADGSVRKIKRTVVQPESLKNAIMPVEGGPPGPDF
jgi:prepilin-type processing-associated H-X9-DG protein